jgi:hypothetical protein
MPKRLLLALFSALGILFAQVDTGTVSGLVRDSSGGAISGAQSQPQLRLR